MSPLAAHQRYYAAAAGRWEGTASVRVTSWGAFLRSGLPPMAWLSFAAMHVMERLLGRPRLTTWVMPTDDPHTVEHLAEVRRAGLLLLRGKRTMALQPDGSSVHVSGTEATWPWLGRPRPLLPGHATVLDDTTTRYQMPMSGQMWDLQFVIGPTEAHSVLRCPWGEAREDLVRARS